MATIRETEDGKFLKDFVDPSQPEFVPLNETLSRLKALPGDPHLLIHLHGGLVNRHRGYKIAKRLAEHSKVGIGNDNYEQMSIIWGSGAFETVITNFKELAEDKLFDRLLKKILEWASGRVLDFGDGARGAGRSLVPPQVEAAINQAKANIDTPQAEEPFPIDRRASEMISDPDGLDDATASADLTRMLESDNALVQLSAALDAELREKEFADKRGTVDGGIAREARKTESRLSPAFFTAYGAELQASPLQTRSQLGQIALKTIIKQAIKAGFAVVRRYREKRDHDFYPTVFEEIARHFFVGTIASRVWKFMKDDTADHFKPGGAGTDLLEKLNTLNAGLEDGRRLRLTIVGHSAGCIFAGEILKALNAPGSDLDLPPVDLIFLAPAVKFKLFGEALNVAGNKVRRFHMFTMADGYEKQDKLLGAFYPRSLLYMISGALEFSEADVPLLGMDRFHRVSASGRVYSAEEQQAIDIVHQFLERSDIHSVWSKTGSSAAAGHKSLAVKHGQFDDDEKTLESIVHLACTP